MKPTEQELRYWISWYSGNYEDEGCTKPPFKFWVSGYRERNNAEDTYRDDCTLCAEITAISESEAWKMVSKHFPDYEERFIHSKSGDWVRSDRFK